MKKIDQLMKLIQPTFIGEPYICECGEEVQEQEMHIIGGSKKGEPIIAKVGCKCEDIRLAREAWQVKQQLDINRLVEFFDTNSLLNEKLKNATLKNFSPSRSTSALEAKQAAMKFVKSFNKKEPGNLLFYGKPRLGKSHLAVGITKAVLKKGYSAVFISVPKLLTKIRSTYNSDGSIKEEDILKHLKEVDLLTIDDLGAEKSATQKDKAWSDSLLWQIIDDRQGKHTIYTSNLTEKGLNTFYEERTCKRIMEDTETILLKE